MKYILLIFLVVLATFSFSQDFKTGTWKGTIQLPDTVLKINLVVAVQRDTSILAVMREPLYMVLEDSTFNGYELNLKVLKKKNSTFVWSPAV